MTIYIIRRKLPVTHMEDEYLSIHALYPEELNIFPCHIHFITGFNQPLCNKCELWVCHLRKFILYRFDNFLDYKINFQGLDSLHDLNTLSSYKCTKLWRTQNKLTLNMHTCEWRIQELINVTLEFRAQNTWIFNPITKLDKLFQLAHSCHHYTSLKHLHWLFQLVRVS